MPAIDTLFQRAHRQISDLERQLHDNQGDIKEGEGGGGRENESSPLLTSQKLAPLSATFGSVSTTLRDIEQLIKRGHLSHKDHYRTELTALEQRHQACKQSFDTWKKRLTEEEQNQRLQRGSSHPITPQTVPSSTITPSPPSWGHQQGKFLDNSLEMGTQALSRLRDQGRTMKAVHKRALDLITSVSVGRDLVRMVNRTRRQDAYIFAGGLLFLIFLFILLYWFTH